MGFFKRHQGRASYDLFSTYSYFLPGLKGMLMLLSYSLGLGIPFIFSAVLIDYLKSAFNWIKRNYKIINLISGSLLVIIGIMMATGTLGQLLNLLS